jgi:hypothetical protein
MDEKGSGQWVCFDCRKMFGRAYEPPAVYDYGLQRPTRVRAPEKVVCPQCAKPMIDMGRFFVPPKRNQVRLWNALQSLAKAGYRFHSELNREWLFQIDLAGGVGIRGRVDTGAVIRRIAYMVENNTIWPEDLGGRRKPPAPKTGGGRRT